MTDQMSKQRREEIRERCELASPAGHWRLWLGQRDENDGRDATLIAHAKEDMVDLLDEVERLEAERDALRAAKEAWEAAAESAKMRAKDRQERVEVERAELARVREVAGEVVDKYADVKAMVIDDRSHMREAAHETLSKTIADYRERLGLTEGV